MPLRNFWIEVEVDGRKTVLSGGPRSRDGGMKVTIWQRELGLKTKAVEITCEAGQCDIERGFRKESNSQFLFTHVRTNDLKNSRSGLLTHR